MFKKRDRKFVIIPLANGDKYEIWIDAERAKNVPSAKFTTDLEGVSTVNITMPLDKDLAKHTIVLTATRDPLCSNSMRVLKKSLTELLK